MEKAQQFSSSELVTILAPIDGKISFSPREFDPDFVQLGDEVDNGETVCMIELNSVISEIPYLGKPAVVMEVLVKQNSVVKKGNILFVLRSCAEERQSFSQKLRRRLGGQKKKDQGGPLLWSTSRFSSTGIICKKML